MWNARPLNVQSRTTYKEFILGGGGGGQSGAAVMRPHRKHQDVGSNPATARNENTHNGETPAQKVPE